MTIASGKGGTGKTTLATNLAYLLSQKSPVILADLDVEEPNSGFFIKGTKIQKQKVFRMVPDWDKEKCVLCGNCQRVCKFNAVIKLGEEVLVFNQLCHGCYACSELCPQNALPMKSYEVGKITEFEQHNLHFVEGKLNVGEEQAVPVIKETINFVMNKFSPDILRIFDAPPGTSCPVIEATKDADYIILITEPTPFGLHDLKLAVEVMRELKKDFGVVINRYGIGNNDVIDYCTNERIPLLGKIPNMKKAAEAYAKGELLCESIPEIKVAMQRIIKNLKVCEVLS
ncbi:MAG: ATP-binding protein [Candidatus Celaenobacter antarcticus]|nr:ATP-binding protein [Candidatus Celaenobacter antarcticus]